MRFLRLLPLLLSALVLGAHFLRSGNVVAVAIILCAPLLVLARRRWAIVALQIGLGLASIEWIRTALSIARERAAIGAPTARMFAILGAVAVFTAAAALPLRRLATPLQQG